MNSRPIRLTTSRLRPSREPMQAAPRARRAGREIRRAQQPRLALDIGDDLALVPGMVAGGQHIGAGIVKLAANLLGQAETVRRVLGVDDRDIDLEVAAQPRQMRLHRVAARAARRHRRREEGSWPSSAIASRATQSALRAVALYGEEIAGVVAMRSVAMTAPAVRSASGAASADGLEFPRGPP